MNSKRIKFIIVLAIVLMAALLVTTIVQLVYIAKAKKEIAKQEEQIRELDEKLDYYNNKNNNSYNIITTGENL